MFPALRRSTLTSRGTPVALPGAWRVAQPDKPHLINSGLEKEINRMSNLPKYYFQDIPEDVMEEIVSGMEAAVPEPSADEMGEWLFQHNAAPTIPQWYESVGEFVSAHRYAFR